jgi:hypothetical protein
MPGIGLAHGGQVMASSTDKWTVLGIGGMYVGFCLYVMCIVGYVAIPQALEEHDVSWMLTAIFGISVFGGFAFFFAHWVYHRLRLLDYLARVRDALVESGHIPRSKTARWRNASSGSAPNAASDMAHIRASLVDSGQIPKSEMTRPGLPHAEGPEYRDSRYFGLLFFFINIEWMVIEGVRKQLGAQARNKNLMEMAPMRISDVIETLEAIVREYSPRMLDYKRFDENRYPELDKATDALKARMEIYVQQQIRTHWITGVEDYERDFMARVVALHRMAPGHYDIPRRW